MSRSESKKALARLYATRGPRQARHLVVLYLRANLDWSARQLERNGSTKFLYEAEMHEPGLQRCRESWRALSFQYGGQATGSAEDTLEGLREDLGNLGFPASDIRGFLEAARPWLWRAPASPQEHK